MILTINMPEDKGVLYQSFRYPAGEVQVRLTEQAMKAYAESDGYEIYIHHVPDMTELLLLVDALNSIKFPAIRRLYLYYLPYGRADRRFVDGDSLGLRMFFYMLSLMQFNYIETFDAHNPTAAYQFANEFDIYFVNKPTDTDGFDEFGRYLKFIKDCNPNLEIAIISPDIGASKRYSLDRYNLPVLQAGKTRDSKTGKLSGFYIEDKIKKFDVGLIIDDICDGGGTFIGLAEEIRKHNPKIKLGLFVSHGIFSKGIQLLNQVFDWVFASQYSFRKPKTDPIHPWLNNSGAEKK